MTKQDAPTGKKDLHTATNSTSVSIPLYGRGFTDSPGSRQSLWEDEILTPEQFALPAREALAAWTGEGRLLLAVLEAAIYTYCKYCDVRTRGGKRLFGEVQEWIWSRDTHWLYAFESICSYLQLDPDYIRKGLQRGHDQPASPTLPSETLREEKPPPADATSFARAA